MIGRARTSAEAYAYIELHPCECGSYDHTLDGSIIDAGTGIARRYIAVCRSCETTREFVFELPDETIFPAARTIIYGDGSPSTLLDAGEWLLIADRYARRVPADLGGLPVEILGRARLGLSAADSAIGEVLTFIPADVTRVPITTLRSEQSRVMYEHDPSRFDWKRLEIVRQTYRELLGEIDRAIEAAA